MKRAVWIALWAMGLLLLTSGAVSAQDDDGTVQITSPGEGTALFGLVEIIGTASHPTQFGGYVLEWSNAQNPDVWLPIQQPVTQQVAEALLGQWDTASAGLPDGTYQIRLRMFLADGSTRDTVIRGLRLQNSPPTDIPTPATFQQASPTAPGGPVPTSPIQQPPTPSPRPEITAAPLPDDPPNADAPDTLINFPAIGRAITNGILFSSGLFGLIVLYLIVRRQLGPNIQRLWWQIRSEIEDDRRGR